MTDEKEYGSLGRLAPEWDGDERERNLTADDIYERFFGWVEDVKGIERRGGGKGKKARSRGRIRKRPLWISWPATMSF